MKILQISDSPWSIGQLSEGIRKYTPHIDWRHMYIPPRDIQNNLEEFKKQAAGVDLVDFHYWNVARQIAKYVPAGVKKTLTHHNQKNLLSDDWSGFDMLFCKTEKSYKTLTAVYPGKVIKIPNTIDHEYFTYISEYPPTPTAIGYVGRICPWKNLHLVARAAYELNIKFYIMGARDKMDYMAQIPEEHLKCISWDFFECPSDERREFYKNISLYIGASNDGREEGTLGLLEAMACGVPVITTPSGMAADIIKHDQNGWVVPFDQDGKVDFDDLKRAIATALENENDWPRISKAAWQTIKEYNHERMAWQYAQAYNQIIFENKPLVSVIVPATYSRCEQVKKILNALVAQTYKNIEAIVVWDEDGQPTGKAGDIINKSDFSGIAIKERRTGLAGYNLAMARNLGIIASDGPILMFNDSRLAPRPDAVSKFVDRLAINKNKEWFFGEKGGGKKDFVENFSAIRRNNIIKAGMFNERITEYGGMSQELRSRFRAAGFKLVYTPEARADELTSSKIGPDRRASIIRMKNLLYRLGL